MKEIAPVSQNFEHPSFLLKRKLNNISNETNIAIEKYYGKKKLLRSDGSLSMDVFLDKNNGIYTEEELKADKKQVKQIELGFGKCSSEDPASQERCLSRWKEDKSRRKGTQVEMMVTIVLNKVLGEDFLVMRTAAYDDYMAGTDFIIVNRKTGKTICALDSLSDDDSKTKETELPIKTRKADKIMKIAEEGGANIKYGVKIKNGEMALAPLNNMPVFYFDVSESEYESLLKVNSGEENKITKKELKVFHDFIKSLEEQRHFLLLADKLQTSDPVMQRIVSFENETLDSFKEIYNKRVRELIG